VLGRCAAFVVRARLKSVGRGPPYALFRDVCTWNATISGSTFEQPQLVHRTVRSSFMRSYSVSEAITSNSAPHSWHLNSYVGMDLSS
jgi:hypothetical protein